jgi:hypothetical protein
VSDEPMDDYDQVVELDLPWVPDAGVSGAVLGQTENGSAILAFRVAPVAQTTEKFAVIMFAHCLATYFGHPNDEARAGHPLYAKGLFQGEGMGVAYEVLRPSWLERVRARNAVNFPEPAGLAEEDRWPGWPRRHFVVPFKEATFECLATDFHGFFTSDPGPLFLIPWEKRTPPPIDEPDRA